MCYRPAWTLPQKQKPENRNTQMAQICAKILCFNVEHKHSALVVFCKYECLPLVLSPVGQIAQWPTQWVAWQGPCYALQADGWSSGRPQCLPSIQPGVEGAKKGEYSARKQGTSQAKGAAHVQGEKDARKPAWN